MVPDHAHQARQLIVSRLSLRRFRSYPRLDLDLAPGRVVVVGPNGVGKTNLLEALHVATQGFSPRTRVDARLVRFGDDAARVAAAGTRGGVPFESVVTIQGSGAKAATLDGAPVASLDELRRALPVLVFTPDRLAVVKGGPLVRRTYLDRMLGRVAPAQADIAGEYARALAQRNAALRRVGQGLAPSSSVDPWTEAVSRHGTALDAARAALVDALGPGFAAHAAALGLTDAQLAYEHRPLAPEALAARLARDLERGTTGLGPHLRDVGIASGDRELRTFGSQGEQRVAVLALLLAEAGLLLESRGEAPVLLLDDVLSELDEQRRAALLAATAPGAQVVVTTTSLGTLPPAGPSPDLVVEVAPGTATVRA
ncbi:MAG: DNA replication and repair protein RecF [Thermoleophilia bacterium]